jgi:hypothetical protein
MGAELTTLLERLLAAEVEMVLVGGLAAVPGNASPTGTGPSPAYSSEKTKVPKPSWSKPPLFVP